MGIITILWEKWVEFRRDFYKITLAAMIAPLMYLIVFGMGIQTTSHGQPYLNFLIPGVVSLTTMNGSFNAIAQNLNVQRLYEKAFDQVMISPTPAETGILKSKVETWTSERKSARELFQQNHRQKGRTKIEK